MPNIFRWEIKKSKRWKRGLLVKVSVMMIQMGDCVLLLPALFSGPQFGDNMNR